MLEIPSYIRGEINRGAGYGLEVPCVYRLYGPKVYIQRMNELVSLGEPEYSNARWTESSSHFIFLCANHFVGRFLLAAYGDQKCMVAEGARRLCPLSEIRRVRFSGVRNILLLG